MKCCYSLKGVSIWKDAVFFLEVDVGVSVLPVFSMFFKLSVSVFQTEPTTILVCLVPCSFLRLVVLVGV